MSSENTLTSFSRKEYAARIKLAAKLLKTAKQCKGQLRDGDCYCAEGVLCEVYRVETGTGQWKSNKWFELGEYCSDTQMPPTVANWFGLKNTARLDGLNDSGVTLKEIARDFDMVAEAWSRGTTFRVIEGTPLPASTRGVV